MWVIGRGSVYIYIYRHPSLLISHIYLSLIKSNNNWFYYRDKIYLKWAGGEPKVKKEPASLKKKKKKYAKLGRGKRKNPGSRSIYYIYNKCKIYIYIFFFLCEAQMLGRGPNLCRRWSTLLGFYSSSSPIFNFLGLGWALGGWALGVSLRGEG